MCAADGELVALAGRAEPLVVVQAPISGAACVAYQLELSLLQRLLDGWGRPWRETVGASFLLRWQEAVVLVDPARATFHLPVRERSRIKLGADRFIDGRIAAFCARLSRPMKHGSVACRERRIEAGEQVWVRGTIATVVDPGGIAPSYRQAPLKSMVMAGQLGLLS